ncbi:MAG: sigma-54-dependent Fis family transcriptional regulator [Candidatus Competibacteraceae bacterium]|nr:sigma-54-dependent Fis family transcriptional regulator [Candidatus Competibacteraceae bacterium]MCB1815653.1 sigma-54-dependent Fis family transcriptional regulator [Candidatus Competibacteraceae bacterium]
MPRILIIEDEKVIRTALRRLLERNDYDVAEAGNIPQAEERYELGSFDLIISDLRLPGPPGTEVIQLAAGVPVLIMTSYASVKSAVDAMHKGAADYIAKPFDHDDMLLSIRRILAQTRLQRQNAALKSELDRHYPVSGIIGDSPAMQQVFDHIHKIAPTDSTVLILGESGTGKELVARALHEHSRRKNEPLIAVNCAAIPDNLIESELFGHERGAFTGAVGAREGLVEAADGGTLFLDEIGELPIIAQARLLRVLQEGEIRRVGSSRSKRVDVRLIAATHRDLEQRVQEGLMRSDLYYRLRVMEIVLPPLRERGEDVVKLAQFLLEKACKKLNRAALQFAPETLDLIRRYTWPGNVREMENAIERAVILSDSPIIAPAMLALDNTRTASMALPGGTTAHAVTGSHTGSHTGAEAAGTAAAADNDAMSLDDYFVHFVLSNQDKLTETELAKRLGISRKSLWERRQRLGIPKARK